MNGAAARPRIRFLMLTYGALAATRRCVQSLVATMPEPFRLFVVDNGSTDGTRQWLAARTEPWLQVRHNARNRGVPGGRNDLLDFALPDAAPDDWLVFIDNDLEFQPGWFEAFVRAMAAHPEARVFGKVGHFLVAGPERRTLSPEPRTTGPVDVVSGGFACWVRADAATAIGRFDEQLGLFWHEDDDWCVRALQLGCGVVAVPEAAIVHHEHASGVATPDLEAGGSLANMRYLVDKWRRLGYVDRDGFVIRRQGPWVPPAVRDALQRRQRRASAIGRTELAAALQLGERLVAAADPLRAFAAARQPVPECLPALLQMQQEQAARAGDRELAERLSLVGAVVERARNAVALRPLLVGEAAAAAAPLGQGLCRAADFDTPGFAALAHELGFGELIADPYARDRTQWEVVALAAQLRRAGIGAGARILVQGGLPDSLLRWLRHQQIDATRMAPGGVAAGPFAAVVCRRELEVDAIAHAVAELLPAGAPVLLCGDVALNGVPSAAVPCPHQLVDDLLARAGLRSIAPVYLGVDDDLLEACATAADTPGPRLCELVGAQLRTSFVVAAVGEVGSADPVLVPARPNPVASLRLGVDLRTLAYADSRSRGIGNYTAQHLNALAAAAPDVAWIAYGCDAARLPAGLRQAGCRLRSPDAFRPTDVDLMHIPDPMNLAFGFDSPLRVFRHPRTTVTFHDLTPLDHYVAQWPRRNREAYHDRLQQLVVGDCHLLANSRFTAQDVIARLHLPSERVTPILAGLVQREAAEAPVDEVAALRRRLGIRGPFVLHVGALDPHKNFWNALQAFLLVRGRRPLQLVVVGAVDPGIEQAAAICAGKRVPDVVFTGWLPRAHLDALYTEAAALLFLSRAEGFGLPILEAMAGGCPVIASDATSHPEVAGDAALLVAPDDVGGAAAALGRLLDDRAHADDLRRRGRARARTFTWRAVAERTLACWRELAVPPGEPSMRAVPCAAARM